VHKAPACTRPREGFPQAYSLAKSEVMNITLLSTPKWCAKDKPIGFMEEICEHMEQRFNP
jgi:hypothetical protein